MALGDYTPTPWADGTIPAINATNLGHIENKVNELDDAFPLYGVGTPTTDYSTTGIDCNNILVGETISAYLAGSGTCTNFPFVDGTDVFCFVSCASSGSGSTIQVIQKCTCSYGTNSRREFIRVRNGATWTSGIYNSYWDEIFNSGTDGNAGNKPAPKPNASATTVIGSWSKVSSSSGGALKTPTTDGTWAYFSILTNASTGIILNTYGSVVSGSASDIVAGVAGHVYNTLFWRIA